MFFRRILSIKIEFTKCSVKHSRLGKLWEFLKLRVARVVHGNSVVISDACVSRSLPYVLCRKEDGVNALKRVEVYRSCHRNCVRLSLLAKFLYYTHTGAQYQCKLISVLRFRNVSPNAFFLFSDLTLLPRLPYLTVTKKWSKQLKKTFFEKCDVEGGSL